MHPEYDLILEEEHSAGGKSSASPTHGSSMRFGNWQFSTSKAENLRVTWPQEPLLDVRDYHPAWNKLAHARRVGCLGLDFIRLANGPGDVIGPLRGGCVLG